MAKLGYHRSFEAIIDSGLYLRTVHYREHQTKIRRKTFLNEFVIFFLGHHPDALRGKCIGVYTGACVNEFEQKIIGYVGDNKIEGYSVMGMARTMASNRISYYFDFKGEKHVIFS